MTLPHRFLNIPRMRKIAVKALHTAGRKVSALTGFHLRRAINLITGTAIGLILLVFVVLPTARYYSAWMDRQASQEKLQALQHQQLAKELVEPAKRVDAIPDTPVHAQQAQYTVPQRLLEKFEGKITGYSLEGWPMIGKTTAVLAGIEKMDLSQLDRIKAFIKEQGNFLACVQETPGFFRCLSKQKIDIAQAIILNGAATAIADAPEAYKEAEAQAKTAKRGFWK